MKNRMIKQVPSIFAAALMLCCFFGIPLTVHADPDSTEIQVAEAQQLEIQLGSGWSGVEFQLKTDAGLYPGTVTVGSDGVLRTEIGGSKTYVLSCLNSTVPIPTLLQSPAAEQTGNPADQPETGSESQAAAVEATSVAGIPVLHLVLFVGGMVIAVGSLIAMSLLKKGKSDLGTQSDDEDE
ncbi:MAG: hypothetical protein QM689_07330 [Oscillospiraceae bacterium]